MAWCTGMLTNPIGVLVHWQQKVRIRVADYPSSWVLLLHTGDSLRKDTSAVLKTLTRPELTGIRPKNEAAPTRHQLRWLTA